MSFTDMDRKVRARGGRTFPLDPSADTAASFASAIADALRRDFGEHPNLVKHLANLTGFNVRTVQNWLQARNGPTGVGVVVLMRHSDEVAMTVLTMSDRTDLRRAVRDETDRRALRKALLSVLEALDPN